MRVQSIRFCSVSAQSEDLIRFFREGLGLPTRGAGEHAAEGAIFPAGESWIEVWKQRPDMPAGTMLQIVVDDADSLAQQARANGLEPEGPMDAHGERIYFLKAPTGLPVTFQSPLLALRPAMAKRALILAVTALALAGCGGSDDGGGGGSALPTVTVVAPVADLSGEIGTLVQIRYVDDDPDSIATTDLFADSDGDLATTQDQRRIATGRSERGGTLQTLTWNTVGSPAGTYFIVAGVRDGMTATAAAPGRVTLNPNAPPEVTVLFPPPTSLTDAALITVAGRASDNQGVETVRVNGVTAASTDGFLTWRVVVPLADDLINVIQVEAEDKTGKIDTAAATILVQESSTASFGSGPALDRPSCGGLDPANGRILVSEEAGGRLLAVDRFTGERSVVSSATVGSGPALQGRLCVRGDGTRALVLDEGLRALLAIDLATGDRTILSDDATGGGPSFVTPHALAVDTVNNRVLVADTGLGLLCAVDLASGDRSSLAGPFTSPVGVALDAVSNLAYVTDDVDDALFEVDLATGVKTLVSTLGTGIGTPFLEPGGVAVDRVRNRVLVADRGRDGLLAVDLTAGDRTFLSGGGLGRGTGFADPGDVLLDPTTSSLVVVDAGLDLVFGVELLGGDRVVLSGGGGPPGWTRVPGSDYHPGMKSKLLLLAASLSLLLPACSGTQRKPGPTRYRAWCNYESKFLGDWDEDKAKIEEQRKAHERRFPTHVTRVQAD